MLTHLVRFLRHLRNTCLLVTAALLAATFIGCEFSGQPDRVPVRVYPPEPPPSSIQLERMELAALNQVRCETGRDANLLAILEIIGSGVGCFDYDSDGRCDLYFPCGGGMDSEKKLVFGKASVMLRNVRDDAAEDVTAESGVPWSCGC